MTTHWKASLEKARQDAARAGLRERMPVLIEVRDSLTTLRTFVREVLPAEQVELQKHVWSPVSAPGAELERIPAGSDALLCWQLTEDGRDLLLNHFRLFADVTNLDGTPFLAGQMAAAEQRVWRLAMSLQPPPGFVPVPEGVASGTCPSCGEQGITWETGWANERASAAYEAAKAKGIVIAGGYNPVVLVDNQPVLSHWSRVSTGWCIHCAAELWRPMNTPVTQTFYKPIPVAGKPVQFGLF